MENEMRDFLEQIPNHEPQGWTQFRILHPGQILPPGALLPPGAATDVHATVKIEAALPEEQLKRARTALARAKAVGEEYDGVTVATATVRARRMPTALRRANRCCRRSCSTAPMPRRSRCAIRRA